MINRCKGQMNFWVRLNLVNSLKSILRSSYMKHKIQCASGILLALLLGLLVAIFITILVVSARAEDTIFPSVIAYNSGNFRQALKSYQKLASNDDLAGYFNALVIYKDLA